jgi:hypothetical protein
MKARAAQMFAEADESMDSEGSPTAKRAARQQGKFKGKSVGGTDADETTDFANLNLGDNSLLMETDTPDISQLMAQTPIKPSTFKPPPAAGGKAQQKPSLATLAQRAREVGLGNVQPRTPPRRIQEDSFDETPRAGYTFEVPDPVDHSVEEEEQEEEQPDDTVVIRSEERVVVEKEEEEVEDIPKEEPAVEEVEAPPSPPPAKETAPARSDDLVVSMDFARMKSFSVSLCLASDISIMCLTIALLDQDMDDSWRRVDTRKPI